MIQTSSLDEIAPLKGERGTVLVFVANGCPTARAYEDRLNGLASAVKGRGVNVVAVNSNNPALSPADVPEEMERRGYEIPYVKDSDGKLARRFGAVCTPHAFLVDGNGAVVYSGRIDDSRLGDRITRRDLEEAIADLLSGRAIQVTRTEPFGCSIVW